MLMTNPDFRHDSECLKSRCSKSGKSQNSDGQQYGFQTNFSIESQTVAQLSKIWTHFNVIKPLKSLFLSRFQTLSEIWMRHKRGRRPVVQNADWSGFQVLTVYFLSPTISLVLLKTGFYSYTVVMKQHIVGESGHKACVSNMAKDNSAVVVDS